MLSAVTSFLFFLGVLAFLASESAVAAHTNSPKTGGGKCGKDCITITGGQLQTKGIPTYNVEIMNNCDVCVSNIKLNCAHFSSNSVIRSQVLKRIRDSPNQCLVNGGGHVASGQLAASFEYSTTFAYPFTVFSVTCHC